MRANGSLEGGITYLKAIGEWCTLYSTEHCFMGWGWVRKSSCINQVFLFLEECFLYEWVFLSMCTDGSLGDGITYLKAIGGGCRGPSIVARQSPPFLLPQLPKHFKKLLLRLPLKLPPQYKLNSYFRQQYQYLSKILKPRFIQNLLQYLLENALSQKGSPSSTRRTSTIEFERTKRPL